MVDSLNENLNFPTQLSLLQKYFSVFLYLFKINRLFAITEKQKTNSGNILLSHVSPAKPAVQMHLK